MKAITCLYLILSIGCSNRDSELDTLQNHILGKWGGLGESNPVLEIRTDSIYYFEEQRAYPYVLENNDLIIKRSDNNAILKNITVDMDTMTFKAESEGLTISAYRFK